MNIIKAQSNWAIPTSYQRESVSPTENTATSSTRTQDQVSLSKQGKDIAHVTQAQVKTTKPLYPLDTNQGEKALDINEYFTPEHSVSPIDLANTPLLMPTQRNIATLTEHSGTEFKQLLADYNIPQPPANISYGSAGQLQLPSDYPYQNELTQALDDNPSLANELRSVAALTSHYVGMRQTQNSHEISIDFTGDSFMQLMFDDKAYSEA